MIRQTQGATALGDAHGAYSGIGGAGGLFCFSEPEDGGARLGIGVGEQEGVERHPLIDLRKHDFEGHVVLAAGSVALALPQGDAAQAVGEDGRFDIGVVGCQRERGRGIAVGACHTEHHLGIRGPALGHGLDAIGEIYRLIVSLRYAALEHIEGIPLSPFKGRPVGREAAGRHLRGRVSRGTGVGEGEGGRGDADGLGLLAHLGSIART